MKETMHCNVISLCIKCTMLHWDGMVRICLVHREISDLLIFTKVKYDPKHVS